MFSSLQNALDRLEKRVGDFDDIFAYETGRTVLIRDRRLGLTFLVTRFLILIYVVAWQTIINQQYRLDSDVIGVARIGLRRPDAPYRWGDQQGPYCTGGRGSVFNPNTNLYSFGNGTYQFADVGTVYPQFPCQYLDERYAEHAGANNEAFLTTRTTVIVEEAVLQGEDDEEGQTAASNAVHPCAGLKRTGCTFKEVSRTDYYTADAEMFVITVEHSMTAPDAGIRRTVRDMAGSMVGPDRKKVDPCEVYGPYKQGCPSYVDVGGADMVDAFPVKSLLRAAGIPTLDARAGPAGSPLGSSTLRASGVTVLLVIHYTNLYLETGSMEQDVVHYSYRVDVIPNAEFQLQSSVGHPDLTVQSSSSGTGTGGAPGSTRTTVVYDDTFPRPKRTVYVRHGVNILVSQSGHVGSFDLQSLLLNLTVSLGLLSAAAWIADNIALQACPLRHIYKQYKEKKTLDFSDVKAAQLYLEDPSFLDRFVEEDNLIEPLPPVFVELMEAKARWEEAHGGPMSVLEAEKAGIKKGALEKAEEELDHQAARLQRVRRLREQASQVRSRMANRATALARQASVGMDSVRSKLGMSPKRQTSPMAGTGASASSDSAWSPTGGKAAAATTAAAAAGDARAGAGAGSTPSAVRLTFGPIQEGSVGQEKDDVPLAQASAGTAEAWSSPLHGSDMVESVEWHDSHVGVAPLHRAHGQAAASVRPRAPSGDGADDEEGPNAAAPVPTPHPSSADTW